MKNISEMILKSKQKTKEQKTHNLVNSEHIKYIKFELEHLLTQFVSQIFTFEIMR